MEGREDKEEFGRLAGRLRDNKGYLGGYVRA